MSSFALGDFRMVPEPPNQNPKTLPTIVATLLYYGQSKLICNARS